MNTLPLSEEEVSEALGNAVIVILIAPSIHERVVEYALDGLRQVYELGKETTIRERVHLVNYLN